MKTLHWKIVDEIVEEKKADHSVVAINVFGSVARGQERPDSDLDIEIISSAENEWHMEKESRYGIEVDYVYSPKEFIEEKVAKYPFLSYVHTKEKVVYDPYGFMVKIVGDLNKYYGEHPEVLAFWESKWKLMRDNKAKGINNPEDGIRAYDEAEKLFSNSKTVTRTFWRT